MLISKEIEDVAADMKGESLARPYVKALISSVVEDESFWRMLLEMFEIVLHRRGYVIVRRSALGDLD